MPPETPVPETPDALFEAVLDMDPDARVAWLEQHCADAAMRDEVLALCRADAAVGVLDGAPDAVAAALLQSANVAEPSFAGRRIGAYRISELLGEGGMATVWAAERCDGAFAQSVAIKCLKHSLVTPSLRRRFERERQILARLEHPNIARLLDGGISDDGVPYIVMERILGEPLDAWCNHRDLSTTARLQIFIKVLGAVQYAHQHLIVHRDLKPANILIGQDGEPRLLDFGIAAMLEETASGLKATRGVAWTPEYAAPEQLRSESISAAIDVYALGVILCELLAGKRPPPAHSLAGRTSVTEFVPSHLVMENPRLSDAQRRRRARALRGDLDAIAIKTLRPDPAARYGSAAELAADLRRHLARQPVQARRGAAAYRGLRFVQRHVAGVAATLFVMLVLAAATVHALQQARQTREALAHSDAVRGFLVDLFENNAPAGALSGLPSTRELLDRGAERASKDFAGAPRLHADMLTTIAGIYRRLGLFDQAKALLERANEVETAAAVSIEDPLVLATRRQLGLLDKDQGSLQSARDILQGVLDARRRTDDDTDALVSAMHELAQVESKLGEHARAIALQREALGVLQEANASAVSIAVARNDLGSSLLRDGQSEAAIAEYQVAYDVLSAKQGPVHEDVALTASNLAIALRRVARYAEAEALLRQVVEADARIYAGDHPQAAQHLNNFGTLLYFRGRPLEARPVLTRAYAMNRTLLGESHEQTATSASNLSLVLVDLERYDEAVSLQRSVLETFRRTYGERHNSIAIAENNLARSLIELGQMDEARELAEASLRLKQDLRGKDDKSTAPALSTLARIDERQGDYAAALRRHEQIMNLEGISMGEADASIAEYFADRGRIRCESGAVRDGLGDIDQALARPEMAADARPLKRAKVLSDRGDCLKAVNRVDEAREAWQQATALRETRVPEDLADSRRLRAVLAATADDR